MQKLPRQKLNFDLSDYFWIIRNFSRKFTSENLSKLIKNYLTLKDKSVLITPSGTYSFYLILKKMKSEVVLPSYVYPDFLEILNKLNLKYSFISINKDSLNLDFNELKKVKGKVILFPLYFGNLPNGFEQILKILKTNKNKVIIDSVQYFYPNKVIDKYADFIIYSFGRGKDLDIFGGGALVASKEFIEKIDLSKLKQRSNFNFLSDYLKYLYISFFTSKLIFNCLTFPLLKLFSKKMENTPKLLFNQKFSMSNYKMPNSIQFGFGIKKLGKLKSRIDKRIKQGNRLKLNFPSVSSSIYYVIPLRCNSEDLMKKGMDSFGNFLYPTDKLTKDFFENIRYVSLYNIENKEYLKKFGSFNIS